MLNYPRQTGVDGQRAQAGTVPRAPCTGGSMNARASRYWRHAITINLITLLLIWAATTPLIWS